MAKLSADPENYAQPGGTGESAQAGTKQNFQTCISRPSGDHPISSHSLIENMKVIINLKLGKIQRRIQEIKNRSHL